MGDFVFNVAKGRLIEYAARVNANDPAASALVLVVLATAGLESDAVLRDKDTLADVLSGATNEVTNSGYARKVLTDTSGITVTVDDANDRQSVDIPDQTWEDVAAGDGWSKALVCYDPTAGSGTDAEIIPLSAHDFVVVPNGDDITLQFHADGVYRAA